MFRQSILGSFEPKSIETRQYDIFMATTGFETRSRFISTKLSPRATIMSAPSFRDRHEFGFKSNLRHFTQLGADVREMDNVQFRHHVRDLFENIRPRRDGVVSVLVDISSMTRTRIATIFAEAATCARSDSIDLNIVYARAKYKPPSQNCVIADSKAVLPEFAGWAGHPGSAPVVIFGLGYEEDRALGIAEYLEPRAVFTFSTSTTNSRLKAAIDRANRSILSDVSPERRLIYSVDRPFELCALLNSLVFGLLHSDRLRHARPIIVPLGPKIFAAASLAVASAHHPAVAVWRVSEGPYAEAMDHQGEEPIVGLRVQYLKKESPSHQRPDVNREHVYLA